MKNNTPIKEIAIVVILVVVLFTLLNPLHWWMPTMMLASLLIVALVVFGLFAVFIMQEQFVDERESHNGIMAGRAAFIAGTAVLTIGIVFQSTTHHVDPWLFITFVIMVLVKLITRVKLT
jgi:cell division protein FtsW (lipid II flippase)